MKMTRCLLIAALVCGLSGVAKADDFSMVVLDPPPPIVNITTYDITSPGVTYTDIPFSDCAQGELPVGSPAYTGCISFLNGTGTDLTSLTLTVSDTLGISGQTADCPTDPNDVFGNPASCPADPTGGVWTLVFDEGTITPGEYFVIAEDGASPDDFPAISAELSATPEPSSIWLLSTGVLTGGFFLADWRRRTMDAVRS